MVEAAKLAFADREAWYGDAEGFEVPLETLLSDSYNAQRRALIGARASADFRPGSPDGRRPRLPSYRIADENSIDSNASLGVVDRTAAEAGGRRTETTGVMCGDTWHIAVVAIMGDMGIGRAARWERGGQ